METENGRYTNQSLVRGAMLLEEFFSSEVPLGISDLSRLTGLPKSSVHRLVSTLEGVGWLFRVEGDKFQIGIKVVVLGRKAGQKMASLGVIHNLIQKLRDDLDETVVVSMMTKGEVFCVDRANSRQEVNCTSQVGRRYPIHAGATGFAVLLGMDERQARELLSQGPLERFTERTETDVEKLTERYRRDRDLGYTIASGQVERGSTGIAVSIWFPAESAWGSLGVVLPDYRCTDEFKEKIIATLKSAKEEIQHKITPGL